MLSRVIWITSELYGQYDLELLRYLSRFDIEVKKNFKQRLFIFTACNKQALDIL